MFKACYAQQMRNIDSAATQIGHIPSIILMENAAIACVNELYRTFDMTDKRVGIFCGKGNNGGDGLAIARHLHERGVYVKLYLVSGNDFSGDAKINFDIVSSADIPMDIVSDTEELEYVIRSYNIIVDAILGTGITGTVRGNAFDVIKAINEYGKYILSVDVPSGINSDSGEICGICVNAHKTVTFAAYKMGMLLYPAADSTGEVVVAPISIPQYVIDSQNIAVNVTDSGFVRSVIKPRENNSHKGDYGKLLIIAGSVGMSGAAYLSAQASLKSGAGLVTLACPQSINSVLEEKTTEVMTRPLPERDGHISSLADDIVLDLLKNADSVLIGPGLGRSTDAAHIVRTVLMNSTVPVVVDADALFAVAGDRDILRECSCDLIFTPHAMEMSRLTGLDINYIEQNRIDVSKEFCEEAGAVLLLKGSHTIVTAPDLTQYTNSTGNPGMASGGSGDVLAGIIGAFTARGIDCAEAAAAGAYIHGMAGDIAMRHNGTEAMSACDILATLPEAFCRILQIDKTNNLC